jgi:hypothetical protein
VETRTKSRPCRRIGTVVIENLAEPAQFALPNSWQGPSVQALRAVSSVLCVRLSPSMNLLMAHPNKMHIAKTGTTAIGSPGFQHGLADFQPVGSVGDRMARQQLGRTAPRFSTPDSGQAFAHRRRTKPATSPLPLVNN